MDAQVAPREIMLSAPAAVLSEMASVIENHVPYRDTRLEDEFAVLIAALCGIEIDSE